MCLRISPESLSSSPKAIRHLPHAGITGKPFIITESNSALATRGYYRMPSDKVTICPDRWDKPYTDPTFACSAYDNCHVPWGNTHEETLKLIRDNAFISGQYVWTGFDYIGEPTPYGWPARSSYLARAEFVFRYRRPCRIPEGRLLPLSGGMVGQDRVASFPALELDTGSGRGYVVLL